MLFNKAQTRGTLAIMPRERRNNHELCDARDPRRGRSGVWKCEGTMPRCKRRGGRRNRYQEATNGLDHRLDDYSLC